MVTGEEEILNGMKYSIEKELPMIIDEVNEEKKENWIECFERIYTERGFRDSDRKPAAYLSLRKTAKKIEDPFIEKGIYTLEMRVIYRKRKGDETGFRYAAVMEKLLRESEIVKEVSDRAALTEMDYTKSGEAVFRITFTREGF